MRFSSVAAVEPPDAVALEVGGSHRLFRGFPRLLRLAAAEATEHHIAIAPTLGAAWALAEFDPGRIVESPDQLPRALEPLPVRALRIADDLIGSLQAVGIDRIGQLMQLPRQMLPARFGPMLLKRLDQALGRLAEPLAPLSPLEPVVAAIELDFPPDSPGQMEEIFRRLLDSVLEQLRRRGCGARTLVLDYVPAVQRTIRLCRASRDEAILLNLLRCAAETTPNPAVRLTGMRLSVPDVEAMEDEQLPLIGGEEQTARVQVDHLIEQLRLRLGEEQVLFPRLVESHLPETSFRLAAPLDRGKFGGAAPLSKSRPLHLLPRPVEIGCITWKEPCSLTVGGEVFRLAHCRGPERIAGTWWEGRNRTRDYFDVAEPAGRRFWIFRVLETRRWYLHGIFA
jgi:protein ImuB